MQFNNYFPTSNQINSYLTIAFAPSDILGSEILDQKTQEFRTLKGPIFTNLLLADEINRAAPKVQSALLEAMQERKVTIGNENYGLPAPFLVIATQNPIEQAGTFELPEAQLQARLKGELLSVNCVDKFPRMTDYVVPSGVRIAHTARVRLGAYIGEGTTIMHEGFVNFNAGT